MIEKSDNTESKTVRESSALVGLGGSLNQLNAVGEADWIEVIHRMEEVYNNVLRYQVELEEKNSALEEAQQFILSVLAAMSDILIVCNRHGMVQEVNQAMLDLLGRSRAEIVGHPLLELLGDDDGARYFDAMLREQSVRDCEVHFLSMSGTLLPVALNCTSRYDVHGRQAGMVLVGRPLGELHKAYHALNRAHEELKVAQQQLVHSEKMASLGKLVAGVAHELNNPISFVLGNVHALQRYRERFSTYLDAIHGGVSPEECAALRQGLHIDRMLHDLGPLIEGTVEGAERTRDIVQDLRRFSVIDREEGKVFDLHEVVKSAIHWATRDAKSMIRVTLNCPSVMGVSGTAGQIHQVVVNLVQNAVDATDGLTSPLLEISGNLDSGQWLLIFHDNGPGIEEARLTSIFDPFFTTKPVGQGVGLGLSISYGIVERHGGKLSAANHPSGGALFTMALPVAIDPSES